MGVAAVVILTGVGVTAFLAGRHTTASNQTRAATTTTTAPPTTTVRPPKSKTVLVYSCAKTAPTFEPTTIMLSCATVGKGTSMNDVAMVTNIVWTTWDATSLGAGQTAQGQGRLHYFTTKPTKTHCERYCETPPPTGPCATKTTPTWSSPFAYCGTTTAPTTACTATSVLENSCPARPAPVYAPIGWTTRAGAKVVLSNPIRQSSEGLIWGTISGGTTGSTGRTFRKAYPFWGSP